MLWFDAIHLFVVVSILALVLIRTEFPGYLYAFVLALLFVQLFLVYTDHTKRQVVGETYVDPSTDGYSVHPLDVSGMTKLTTLPDRIKADVSEGIDELIAVSASQDSYIMLDTNDPKYADQETRKAYKHIDYFLEKLHLYDGDIYEAVVPAT